MSWFSDLFHPQKPYQAGQEQLDKYYGQSQGYLNPYNQNGVNQGKTLQDMIDALKDPQALQDKWAKGYKESEAAKNMEGLAQQHGLDAASSMGIMGSSPALSAIQAGTSAIGAQDRQNYLNDLMEKYKTGISTAQGVYNTGAGAAGQQSNNANTMGQNSAGRAFGEANAGPSMLSHLLGMGGKGLMDYFTGGMGRGAWSTGGG
jgi:hypothetical protein